MGRTFALLKTGNLDVQPLAQRISEIDWRQDEAAFNAARWSGWCVNGCTQTARGDFLLGYSYNENHKNSQYLPEIEPLLNWIPGIIHAVRLFRLGPGTVVPTHTDTGEIYLLRHWSEVRKVHIPIVINNDCYHSFIDEGKIERRFQMCLGQAWYLNGNEKHGALNRGASDRWHLVIDVEPSAALDALCTT